MNRRSLLKGLLSSIAVGLLQPLKLPWYKHPTKYGYTNGLEFVPKYVTTNRDIDIFGGSCDLWGQNLTPEDINSAGFGFNIPEGAKLVPPGVTVKIVDLGTVQYAKLKDLKCVMTTPSRKSPR